MSELKTRFIDDTYAEYHKTGNHDLAQIYAKSEADKYIGELRKERDWLAKDRAQAYNDLEKRAQLNIKQEESIRHQKYKRCLAMVKWCFTKSNYHFVLARHGENVKENNRKSILYSKWRNRWQELAEKFKESDK